MRLFTMGDIHGCFHTLRSLIDCIRPDSDDTIVFLGDYIDRGPDSKQVLDYIICLKNQGLKVITLKGNHEDLMMKSFLGKNEMLSWMYNGGKYTLESFGVSSLVEIDPFYINFIENMPYYYVLDTIYFVHAGFNEQQGFQFTDKKAMLWIRKDHYQSDFFKEKKILHGHTPQRLETLKQHLTNQPNVINIDTGCVYNMENGYGYLTAYEIYSNEIYYAKNAEMISIL
jgi:serine/threonine protein phosphatase 1